MVLVGIRLLKRVTQIFHCKTLKKWVFLHLKNFFEVWTNDQCDLFHSIKKKRILPLVKSGFTYWPLISCVLGAIWLTFLSLSFFIFNEEIITVTCPLR